MTKMERCEMAKQAHESGLNCAQAVLAAFTDITGLTAEQSMAIAGGFGGGMSCGGICGVVSGCVAVLGAACPHTRENGAAGKQRVKHLAQEFRLPAHAVDPHGGAQIGHIHQKADVAL